MPEDMPMGTSDGKFAFMLHLRRTDFPQVENPNMMLMFKSHDAAALESLKKAGLKLERTKDKLVTVMTDSVGIRSEIALEPEAVAGRN
jgi:hypothetical protein